ncbi:MAG: hypothetical protein J6W84_07195 [Bacteroidales bacterium]|nr:hypothetical protein [Bacteroidales bacterium]
MKKVLVIAVCVALVGTFASCNKKCTCKTYPGEVTATMSLKEVQDTYAKVGIDIKKCSDMNTVVEANGTKTGVECR